MELEVNVICITADKKQFARCFSSSIIDKSVKEITVMTSSILFLYPSNLCQGHKEAGAYPSFRVSTHPLQCGIIQYLRICVPYF